MLYSWLLTCCNVWYCVNPIFEFTSFGWNFVGLCNVLKNKLLWLLARKEEWVEWMKMFEIFVLFYHCNIKLTYFATLLIRMVELKWWTFMRCSKPSIFEGATIISTGSVSREVFVQKSYSSYLLRIFNKFICSLLCGHTRKVLYLQYLQLLYKCMFNIHSKKNLTHRSLWNRGTLLSIRTV